MTMEPASGSKAIPTCEKLKHGQKHIGWGKYGLQFSVPVHEVEIRGGKPDVDYVRYLLKAKNDNGYLELWFGIYAMGTDPDDDLLVNSVKFEQRDVVDSSGHVLGRDGWGKLTDGTIWRQTTDGSEGSRYRTQIRARRSFSMES